jgi:hypothetical protein
MGLFTKKQEQSEKSPAGAPGSSKDGARRFGFGRSKPAPITEELKAPPTPWAGPENLSTQPSTATSALTSRRNSFTSVRSSVLKELKYEAMVNHLFQQQCSKLFIFSVSCDIDADI